jgi:UPF0271 protein
VIAFAVRPFGVPISRHGFHEAGNSYREHGVESIPEFYAHLEYDAAGNLILSGVHEPVDPAKARERTLRPLRDGVVTTTAGLDIAVKAKTVCIHSDTPDTVTIAAELARALRQK